VLVFVFVVADLIVCRVVVLVDLVVLVVLVLADDDT
jgi:hypothetical protein